MSAPIDPRCAECGEPLVDDGVPLAALYVDEDGDEIDADLVFCTPDHLEAWVTRVPSIAVARSGSEALWRGAPETRLFGYVGCFVAVGCALAVLLLIAYVVGRIVG